MATISNTPRPGYVYDSADAVWYPIGTGTHSHNEIATTIVDAKGDLIAATAADTVARLAVGANGTVLTAASGEATGLQWATPAAGGMTLIASGSLSGASVVLSSIAGTYNDLRLVVRNYLPATDGNYLYVRFNNDSGSKYRNISFQTALANPYTFPSAETQTNLQDSGTSQALIIVDFFDYANATTWKISRLTSITNDHTDPTLGNVTHTDSFFKDTSAITSIGLSNAAGNFTSGTYILYGVK
jgi:hypothetical protein